MSNFPQATGHAHAAYIKQSFSAKYMVPDEQLADFAEVCGIHAGDGWMGSYNNEIGYGTNPKEEQYFQEVRRLYQTIFSPDKMRILRRLAVEFRFNSREGQKLLMSVGFPRGRKLDSLRVPQFVFKNKEYAKNFLRGVVDTDGHVYWRKSVNNYYLVIYWVTTAHAFAEDVASLLRKLGYHPQVSIVKGMQSDGHIRRRLYRISLMRHAEVKQFLEAIGFRNKLRWMQAAKRPQDILRYHLDEPTTTFLSRLRISENEGPVV